MSSRRILGGDIGVTFLFRDGGRSFLRDGRSLLHYFLTAELLYTASQTVTPTYPPEEAATAMMTTMAATTAQRITISFAFSHQTFFFSSTAWEQGSHGQSPTF